MDEAASIFDAPVAFNCTFWADSSRAEPLHEDVFEACLVIRKTCEKVLQASASGSRGRVAGLMELIA